MTTRAPITLAGLKVRADIRKGDAVADALAEQLAPLLPDIAREVRFHPTRRWRFDLASALWMLAVEVEGGAWVRGGHNRGAHFRSDIEKYGAAFGLGWHVLRVMPEHVRDGSALAWVAAWRQLRVAERAR